VLACEQSAGHTSSIGGAARASDPATARPPGWPPSPSPPPEREELKLVGALRSLAVCVLAFRILFGWGQPEFSALYKCIWIDSQTKEKVQLYLKRKQKHSLIHRKITSEFTT
jgi:hypothetical protein